MDPVAEQIDAHLDEWDRFYHRDDALYTVGSLFSGIGGLDLGFEREGFKVIWQCERDEYCRKVLKKHWPDVPCFEDVTGVIDPPQVDVLIGGFPCQDVSNAGKKAGIDGARSGLWFEYIRLIRLLRPRVVFVENVPGLLIRGLDRVLGSLAECGYNAEWTVLSAESVGAAHRRNRVGIIAYPDRIGQRTEPAKGLYGQGKPRDDALGCPPRASGGCAQMEDSICAGSQRDVGEILAGTRQGRQDADLARSIRWIPEPDVCRLADGISSKLDRNRLKALGNAVVPQWAQYFAYHIKNYLDHCYKI